MVQPQGLGRSPFQAVSPWPCRQPRLSPVDSLCLLLAVNKEPYEDGQENECQYTANMNLSSDTKDGQLITSLAIAATGLLATGPELVLVRVVPGLVLVRRGPPTEIWAWM